MSNCAETKFLLLALPLPLLMALAHMNEASAADVRFSTAAQGLRGAALTQEDRLIGFVGDVVELPNGQHRISISAPENYELILGLNVTNQRVSILETTPRPENCKPELKVKWGTPEVREGHASNGIIDVVLFEPQFGEPTGQTSCAMPAFAPCAPNKIILHATSQPQGAEIWINNEKQEYRTNTTLSVPYCGYETQKSILLRFPEKVNCLDEIDLAPDARIELNCLLREASAETFADEEPGADAGETDPGAIVVPIPAEE